LFTRTLRAVQFLSVQAFSPNSTVTQGIAVRGPCHRRLRAINGVGITNIRDSWVVATRKLDHAFADHSCLVSQVLPICSLRTNDGVQESGPEIWRRAVRVFVV